MGLMLLTTGNKSEMSVGYATLYGDMCGGFSVLKDVYKTTAFKLSEWRNQIDSKKLGLLGPAKVMPQRIITKPPSAELKEGQTDEASLGSYDTLDAVLKLLTEEMQSPEKASLIATKQLQAKYIAETQDVKGAENIKVSLEYCQKIARLVRIAQYKRRQAPPGVVIGKRDLGMDYRFPIAGNYSL